MPPDAPTATGRRPSPLEVDFDERPFTVAWELTRACALACAHCRAEAQPRRDPRELTLDEARRVIDELVDLAPPVLVLTGGDPMMRPDLYDIVEYAVSRGLRVSVSPTTTALSTKERMARLQALGVQMVHVSLDGAVAATHDAFRGFPGTYDRATRLLDDLADLGMPAQVGTTVTRSNLRELPLMVPQLVERGVRVWSLFFLVPTGRAHAGQMIEPQEAERTWEWLADLAGRVPMQIRTTAAPQFRRTMLRRARGQAGGAPVRLTGAGYELREGTRGVQTRGVNDGKGFLFIDHTGNLCPSGFLQVPAGNVRTDSIAAVYRDAPLFRELRDVTLLRGRCGRCRFADLCGGSRARALGVSGSYLDEDPLCGLSEAEIAGDSDGPAAG